MDPIHILWKWYRYRTNKAYKSPLLRWILTHIHHYYLNMRKKW